MLVVKAKEARGKRRFTCQQVDHELWEMLQRCTNDVSYATRPACQHAHWALNLFYQNVSTVWYIHNPQEIISSRSVMPRSLLYATVRCCTLLYTTVLSCPLLSSPVLQSPPSPFPVGIIVTLFWRREGHTLSAERPWFQLSNQIWDMICSDAASAIPTEDYGGVKWR